MPRTTGWLVKLEGEKVDDDKTDVPNMIERGARLGKPNIRTWGGEREAEGHGMRRIQI